MQPVKKRFIILDALRGFALLGICLANYPEFIDGNRYFRVMGLFLLGMLLSRLWIGHFRFGPVEWVWRMLTYGQYLPLRRDQR